MVLDMTKPKNKNSTWPRIRGREYCEKVDSQGEHFTGIQRSIPQRSSLSWITTRNRMDRTNVQRVGRICTRRSNASLHSRGKEKMPRTMVSHFEQCICETSIRFSSCCLYEKSFAPRVRRTNWRVHYSRTIQYMTSHFKHIVVEQELEMSSSKFFNWWEFFLLQLVSFTVDDDPKWPKGGVDGDISHVICLTHFAHNQICAFSKSSLAMCLCAFIPSSCHPWCVAERCWHPICPSAIHLHCETQTSQYPPSQRSRCEERATSVAKEAFGTGRSNRLWWRRGSWCRTRSLQVLHDNKNKALERETWPQICAHEQASIAIAKCALFLFLVAFVAHGTGTILLNENHFSNLRSPRRHTPVQSRHQQDLPNLGCGHQPHPTP